ncbi:MAG: carboxylating nicotinate-nucleotide diphosphorylase [Cyanobacteria bacterium]|nr:carboxylating nicotinate-nucleotide diphosphorylase [Cyanobacteriota bacterium]
MEGVGLLLAGGGLEGELRRWLREDVGRGDWSTIAVATERSRRGLGQTVRAVWRAKEEGTIAGLPLAGRVFELLAQESGAGEALAWRPLIEDGDACGAGEVVAELEGPAAVLLTGERTALNLVMRLSGIATLTRQYVDCIGDLPARLVDTRKTTPGLRLLEKYAVRVGGGGNHRLGLDDAVMLKDNHLAAAGGIAPAIAAARSVMPYPLTIEVETESIAQVQEATVAGADIVMLDNMPLEMMREAVTIARSLNPRIVLEASGNVTLETIRAIAETGVDYISTSAMVTRSRWLDLSMRIIP